MGKLPARVREGTSSVDRHRIRGQRANRTLLRKGSILGDPGCIPQSRAPNRQDEGQRISKTIRINNIIKKLNHSDTIPATPRVAAQ